MRLVYVAIGLLVTLIACTPAPSPQPPPTPDASDASSPVVILEGGSRGDVFDIACSNLVALGCPEGSEPSCATKMRTAQTAHLTDYAPSCVALQKSAEQVRGCSPAWKNGCRGARSSP